MNLNELTLDNLGQWPTTVKKGVLLGVALLISALAYWLIIQDNLHQYDRLHVQEQELKADFEKKQYQVGNLVEYSHQLHLMQERFAFMLRKLPTENEMPELLEEISKAGIASGLKLALFAPQEEQAHDFYLELAIKMTVTGNYFQLAEFISRIAEINRIVTVSDFSVEGVFAKDSKEILMDELVMNITAKIYRYRTQ